MKKHTMKQESKCYSLSQLAAIYCVYKDLSPLTHSVRCCTCGKNIIIEAVEDCYNYWGHFISRSVEPKLKYHPLNSHAQCINCNVNNHGMYVEYKKFMKFRYGEDIEYKLLNSEIHDRQYYVDFYIEKLLNLSLKFLELQNVVVQQDTGEIISNVIEDNKIMEQFYTYSKTFKDDLDTVCKTLKSNTFIEYNKL